MSLSSLAFSADAFVRCGLPDVLHSRRTLFVVKYTVYQIFYCRKHPQLNQEHGKCMSRSARKSRPFIFHAPQSVISMTNNEIFVEENLERFSVSLEGLGYPKSSQPPLSVKLSTYQGKSKWSERRFTNTRYLHLELSFHSGFQPLSYNGAKLTHPTDSSRISLCRTGR